MAGHVEIQQGTQCGAELLHGSVEWIVGAELSVACIAQCCLCGRIATIKKVDDLRAGWIECSLRVILASGVS